MGRHFTHRLALALLISLAAPDAARAASAVGTGTVAESLSHIENRWVDIRYVMTDTGSRLTAARALRNESRAALAENPNLAEVKFWHGMVLLLEPEYKRDLGSLRVVQEAKQLFEEAEAENPQLLDGRVETALGMLYSGVPGWPIAFGDDKQAAAHFLKALSQLSLRRFSAQPEAGRRSVAVSRDRSARAGPSRPRARRRVSPQRSGSGPDRDPERPAALGFKPLRRPIGVEHPLKTFEHRGLNFRPALQMREQHSRGFKGG